MNKMRLEEFCRLGEKADHLLLAGRTRDALKIYENILRNLKNEETADSYFLAKVTLGVLRGYIKLGDFKSAYDVWNISPDDHGFGIGIYALENAQTTVQDMVTYDMICAFLHSLSDGDHQATATAINQYLSRVCEQSYENGDRSIMMLALSNWKQHLRETFTSAIPLDHARTLIKFEKLLGETVKLQAIDFPAPTPWEKPDEFREITQILSWREGKGTRKTAKKKSGAA
jgi:hypothetical protein